MGVLGVLIDVNVIITFITNREDPYQDDCNRLMDLCSQGRFIGYAAFRSLSIIWYVIRRQKSEEEARFWLDHICNLLTIAVASQAQVIKAIDNRNFRAFEDCLQDVCAVNAGADFIVTCNAGDFVRSKTQAVTPDVLVRILEGRQR